MTTLPLEVIKITDSFSIDWKNSKIKHLGFKSNNDNFDREIKF